MKIKEIEDLEEVEKRKSCQTVVALGFLSMILFMSIWVLNYQPFHINIESEITSKREILNPRNTYNGRDIDIKDMCIISDTELKAAYDAGFEYPVPLPCAKILTAVQATKKLYDELFYQRIYFRVTLICFTSFSGLVFAILIFLSEWIPIGYYIQQLFPFK